MATNGANITEETDMTDCDGEKVVTMMDVLQEQQEFEDDANAVLGASDDKNCTYSKGYIKRQALYACLTCCHEAKEDPSKRAGVCLACSLNCHENHELIELYTKRNFRCDCGNPKFNSHPCQFTPTKTELNEDNFYNQNFSGLYCVCQRPYPDPESTNEDDMIQCIVCEDWLHSSHLEATLPPNDQCSEMICKVCMEDYDFLHDYSRLAVNVEIDDVDIVTVNGETVENIVHNGDLDNVKVTSETLEVSDLVNKENNSVETSEESNENEDVIYETSEKMDAAENIAMEDKDKMEQIENQVENKIEEPANLENKECDNQEKPVEKNQDQEKPEMQDSVSENKSKETNEPASKEHNDNDKSTEAATSGENIEITKPKDTTEKEKTDAVMDAIDEILDEKTATIDETIMNTETPESNNIESDHTNKDECGEITDKECSEGANTECGETTDKESGENTDKEFAESSDIELVETTDKESGEATDKESGETTDKECGEKDETIPESDKITSDSTDPCNEYCVTNETENSNVVKRKLSTDDKEGEFTKKQKIDEGNSCSRPKNIKRKLKGAAFWPSNFRQKLCSCGECIAMYKDLEVLFLIDVEDTVSFYESLGKENSSGSTSQYEKGLEALSSLDRIQQINALTEYNKMRDKLLDFLKSFKDRKEIVKEEDIKAFFAGMKPRREQDGVYFCR